MWAGRTFAVLAVAGAIGGLAVAPAAASDPVRDYNSVRADWQRDRVITACRFTLEQLENARSMTSPEDGYTDFEEAIAREISRQRNGGCPGGGGVEGDPVVSRARMLPATLRAGRRATLRFSLSKPARVRAVVERQRTVGRRVRWTRVGVTSRRGRVGVNRVALGPRVGRRALTPGRYRVVLTATDEDGVRSRAVRTAFRVVR